MSFCGRGEGLSRDVADCPRRQTCHSYLDLPSMNRTEPDVGVAMRTVGRPV